MGQKQIGLFIPHLFLIRKILVKRNFRKEIYLIFKHPT